MRVIVPGGAADRVTTTSYWPSGQPRGREKAQGATDQMYFDTAGRLSRMVRDNEAGGEVEGRGRARRHTSPSGVTSIRMITRRVFRFHSPDAMLSLSGLCPPLPR